MEFACTIQDLRAARGIRAVTIGPRELVVIEDASSGALFAVDRACPHQGFGLEEGRLEAGALTCDWHGWRFDLATGTCLTGGEDIRSYSTAIRGTDLYVDVDVVVSAGELDAAAAALVSALETGSLRAAARQAARLVRFDALERAATVLVRYAATHGEGALELEAVAISDVLELAPLLPDAAIAALCADVAVGVAERYARAPLRFGPEPATPIAWATTTASGALAAAIALDEDEAEALTAGMVRAGVTLDELGLGLAAGAIDGLRDPDALLLVERAVRLARQLGADVARVLLPPVAASVAAAGVAPERSSIALAADELVGSDTEPRSVIEACGLTLSRFDASVEDDPRGAGSMLGVGQALAYAGAAAWAIDLLGPAASSAAAHARALAEVATGPATTLEAERPVPEGGIATALAAGPANTSRGLAICLAATRTALLVGGEHARCGAYRLLTSPKRERFVTRDVTLP